MRLLASTVTRRTPDVSRPSIEFVLRTCPDCDFLLVNNGRDPREFPPDLIKDNRFHIMHIPVNVGHPGGINFAVQQAAARGYEFFLLLDDDITFLTPDWYRKCLELMAFDPQIGVIGAKIVNPDEKTIQWAYTQIGPKGWEFHRGLPRHTEALNRIYRVNSVQCIFFFVRVAHMQRVGYFDLLFSPTQYEDADYCFRMWLAGFSCVYDGRIEMAHHFQAYQAQDAPMRQLHSSAHAMAMDLKYNGCLRFGLALEEKIGQIGREIVLPGPPVNPTATTPSATPK